MIVTPLRKSIQKANQPNRTAGRGNPKWERKVSPS
jgi:hypothetical protein